MSLTRLFAVTAATTAVITVTTSTALAQFVPVEQERSVVTQVEVSSGDSDGDFDSASSFDTFSRMIMSSITGPNGAGADASALQNSVLSPTLISAAFSASCAARTGTTFITGDATAQSNFLYIFNVAAPTPVQFNAAGSISYVGRDPSGEPSDLYGSSTVRLLNGITEEVIASLEISIDGGVDSALFTGTLPAGQYVILANTRMHAFSADLLGPPPRSGSGESDLSFSLAVVPAPSAAVVMNLGVFAFGLRRRR